MSSEVESKYTPLSKVKELKSLLKNKDGLTRENIGLDHSNRGYLYRVRDEEENITKVKFNELLQDCFNKRFLQINEYQDLKIRDNLSKEIELSKYDNFDNLWEYLVTDSDKKLERNYYISKKIFEERFKNNKNIYYVPKPSRSINIQLEKNFSEEDDIQNISIISDCIGKQYKVDGKTFDSRGAYIQYFQKSREAFKKLVDKKIEVFAGTRNFLIPFDFQFTDYQTTKNNFVNVLVQYRNFNFLNFGGNNKNEVEISESIENDNEIYDDAYKKIDNFLKNSSIL